MVTRPDDGHAQGRVPEPPLHHNSVESLRATIPIYDTDVAFSTCLTATWRSASPVFITPLCRNCGLLRGRPDSLDHAGTEADGLREPPRFFEKVHARSSPILSRSRRDEAHIHEALEIGRRVSRLRQACEAIPEELEREYQEQALPFWSASTITSAVACVWHLRRGALLTKWPEFFDAPVPILASLWSDREYCVALIAPENTNRTVVRDAGMRGAD